ncbi:heterokaryon incompatibility protein-domain-containing protein [Nemania serpens]|nr:heterokaryon incompatibility protein-domain-containing protein [Nemania serpens]
MRLINTQTQELTEFFHTIPPYAILSHTWEKEEVTFQEYILATGPEARRYTHIRQKAGFSKILGACQRARYDGLKYLWCDTNCIDKSSSAELSEAINSMYAWYRDSVVCYAFLADVDGSPGTFEKSRWFTRGWTLQELLAPKEVVFFDERWGVLGDRGKLAQIICKTTRIHIGALHNRDTVPDYSIAQRMSWAADRATSRQEDMAYCLLGIFNIDMPLLYGESKRAFLRFQQEIIKVSDDQSLLAWTSDDTYSHLLSGILAPSPHVFRNCGSVVRNMDLKKMPLSLTNIGICMKVPVITTSLSGIILAGLNCAHEIRRYPRNDSWETIHKPPTSSRSTEPRRHVKIWIWLWSLQHDVYRRVHFPTSTISLEYSYPGSVQWTAKEIFIATSLGSESRHQADHCQPQKLDPSEAGVLITVGSGIMDIWKHGRRAIPPFVAMAKEILSDAHGQPQIEFDIVFQEAQAAINPVDMSRILRH